MAKISPLMLAPPAIFGLLACLFYVGMQRDNPDALPTALAGQPAPQTTFEPLGNETLLVDGDLRKGDAKLVNFWASWCGPCRAEHPSLTRLADDGVPVYGVNYKDRPGDALGFLDELGNPFGAIGVDASGRQAIDWGVAAVPETFVLDGEGNIVLRFAGPITQRAIERDILPALEKARAQ